MKTSSKEKKDKIAELEELAQKVLDLKKKREQRRPLLIEFCGSPKSGKSTTIGSLNLFLRRNNFKTAVLSERASVCPIENKTHPNFNIWTMTSTIAEMLAVLEKGKDSVDIVISDRGIFDALCWFKWLNENPKPSNPHLSSELYNDLHKFILNDIWKRTIDLIYVFKVRPETSIEREYANLLTEKRGSIMKEDILSSYNTSIDEIYEETKSHFRNIIKIDTDIEDRSNNPNLVNYTVTKNVLENLLDLMDEKIGYIKKDKEYKFTEIEYLKNTKICYANRNIVEDEFEYIQPIAIAVVTDYKHQKVLTVKKNAKTISHDSPEKDKLLLYIGGHVRLEDDEENLFFHTIKNALHREIQEEINESLIVGNIKPFIMYSEATTKSQKHMAICYVLEMDLDDRSFKITSDELTMKSGTTKSGRILKVNELIDENMEEWSLEILKKVFKVVHDTRQKGLFHNQTESI